jgi:hypothetical protein
MKKITVKELSDSIRKNGLEQTRGSYFKRNSVPSSRRLATQACAIGQAAINLKVDATRLHRSLNNVDTMKGHLGSLIIDLNDHQKGNTFVEIADYLDSLDMGDTIIEIR